MALSPKTELVIHLLRNKPEMNFPAIAKKACVSVPYVSRINSDMEIRQTKKQSGQLGVFDGKRMAKEDLRECLKAYSSDADKRLVLKGYAQAALALYKQHGGDPDAIA